MDLTFILNPRARNGAAAGKRIILETLLKERGVDGRLLLTEGPGHASVLARDWAGRTDALVAAGGDGTIHEVSRGLIESGTSTPLGILPLGTGNDFVKMLDLPRGPQDVFDALLSATIQPVDYGRISWEGDDGGGRALFVNAIGAGFDARVAVVAHRYKALPGLAAYLTAALRTLARWQSPVVQVTARYEDETVLAFDAPLLLVTVGNGVSSGGGFYLTPDASITDGALDLCLIEAISTARVLSLMPQAMRGRHGSASEVTMTRLDELVVRSATPLTIHADGEILTERATTFTVEVVAGGLNVLVPVPNAHDRRKKGNASVER